MTECPECGHEKFSMLVEFAQFGNVHGGEHPHFEGLELGDVTNVETDDQGRDVVGCGDCMTKFAIDDENGLVEPEFTETVDVPKAELQSLLEFVRHDPALDTAPSDGDVLGAIDVVDDAVYEE
jgi:hypothetical protein